MNGLEPKKVVENRKSSEMIISDNILNGFWNYMIFSANELVQASKSRNIVQEIAQNLRKYIHKYCIQFRKVLKTCTRDQDECSFHRPETDYGGNVKRENPFS